MTYIVVEVGCIECSGEEHEVTRFDSLAEARRYVSEWTADPTVVTALRRSRGIVPPVDRRAQRVFIIEVA